ncbi:SHOCT domain-containing protein [Streptococcus dentiloxodontae]
MNQQEWLDYFKAVNGREPSIPEMAEAAKRGEFSTEAKVSETSESYTQQAQANSQQTSKASEQSQFTQANSNSSQSYQQQVQQGATTNEQFTQFANQANQTIQQAGDNIQAMWKKQNNYTKTNIIMLCIGMIPTFFICMFIYGLHLESSYSYSGYSGLTFGLIITVLLISLIANLIYYIPALVNKSPYKWLIFFLNLFFAWTILGWLVILIISISTNSSQSQRQNSEMMMHMMASNQEANRQMAQNQFQSQQQSSSNRATVTDELMKLQGLKDAGILTEDEFQAQKAKILGQ